MRPQKDNQGYTIIEVLMALAVFSIGLMAMGALQSRALIQTGEIGRKNQAWTLLTDQVERLKGLPFYANGDGVNNDGDGFVDEFDEEWAELTGDDPADPDDFGHTATTGIYTVHWRVVNDQPIAQQANIPGVTIPGNVTVSKTITVSVTETGGDPRDDALLTVGFVKILSESI